MDKPIIMRISIITILVSISAVCFGQIALPDVVLTDTSYYWLPASDPNPIEDGASIVIIGSSSLEYEIIRLYDEYAAQLPTNKRHRTNLLNWEDVLEDCDITTISKTEGGSMWFELVCRNEDHFVDVPIKSSFEGFIKWLRTK